MAVHYCAERDEEAGGLVEPLVRYLKPGTIDPKAEWYAGLGERVRSALLGWEHRAIDVGFQKYVGVVHVHAGMTRRRIPVLAALLVDLDRHEGLGRIRRVTRGAMTEFIGRHVTGRFFKPYLESEHGRMAVRSLVFLIHEAGWPRPRLDAGSDAAQPGLPSGFLRELIEEMKRLRGGVSARPGSPLSAEEPEAPVYQFREGDPGDWRVGLWFRTPGVRGHSVEGLSAIEGRPLLDRAFLPVDRVASSDATVLRGLCGRGPGDGGTSSAESRATYSLPRWPRDPDDWAIFGADDVVLWTADNAAEAASGEYRMALPESAADISLPDARLERLDDLGWLDLDGPGGSAWRMERVRIEAARSQRLGRLAWHAGAPATAAPDAHRWLRRLQDCGDDSTLLIDNVEPSAVLEGWTPPHRALCRVEVRPDGADAKWIDVTDDLTRGQSHHMNPSGVPTGSCLLTPGSGELRVRGRGLRRGDPDVNQSRRYRGVDEVHLRTDRTLYGPEQGGTVEAADGPGGRGQMWRVVHRFAGDQQGGARFELRLRSGSPLTVRVPVHQGRLERTDDPAALSVAWSAYQREREADARVAQTVPRWRLRARPYREGEVRLRPCRGPEVESDSSGDMILCRLAEGRPGVRHFGHADFQDIFAEARHRLPGVFLWSFWLKQEGQEVGLNRYLLADDRLPAVVPAWVARMLDPEGDGALAEVLRVQESPAAAIKADPDRWTGCGAARIRAWHVAAEQLGALAGAKPKPVIDGLQAALAGLKMTDCSAAWQAALVQTPVSSEPDFQRRIDNYKHCFHRDQPINKQKLAAMVRSLRAKSWATHPRHRSLLLLVHTRSGAFDRLADELREWSRRPCPIDPNVAALMRNLCPSLCSVPTAAAGTEWIDLPDGDRGWIDLLAGAVEPGTEVGDDWLTRLIGFRMAVRAGADPEALARIGQAVLDNDAVPLQVLHSGYLDGLSEGVATDYLQEGST